MSKSCIFVNLIFMLSLPPDWGNKAICQLSSTFVSCHRKCVKNMIPMKCRVCAGHLTPVWDAQVSISTPACVNFELCPSSGDIHICRLDFDALVQGNEVPTIYRVPSGDRTRYLQTEATPPAASCPALSCHAAEIVSKKHNPNDMPRGHRPTPIIGTIIRGP